MTTPSQKQVFFKKFYIPLPVSFLKIKQGKIMVSGRYRGIERAEPEDSLASDTRSEEYSIRDISAVKDAVKTTDRIEIDGRVFERGPVTQLVRRLRKYSGPLTELPYFKGDGPRVITAKGSVYIALMKRTGRQVIVYDPSDRTVKQIKFMLHKRELSQEGSDDVYLDDIAALETEGHQFS